jgi:hypothetical protein
MAARDKNTSGKRAQEPLRQKKNPGSHCETGAYACRLRQIEIDYSQTLTMTFLT